MATVTRVSNQSLAEVPSLMTRLDEPTELRREAGSWSGENQRLSAEQVALHKRQLARLLAITALLA